MGTWIITLSLAITCFHQFVDLSHAGVNKTSTVLKSDSYYDCFDEKKAKSCEERIYPDNYPTYCDAWKKIRKECFLDNGCSSSFIRNKKAEFVTEYNIFCPDDVKTTSSVPYRDCIDPSYIDYCDRVFDWDTILWYADTCSAWREIIKCLDGGKCSDTYISAKKKDFESKYGVKCMTVFIDDIGYYNGIRISAACGNSNVTCETRLPHMTCALWHSYRKCFDAGLCLFNEVEAIKKRVMMDKMLTCGTGSASATISFVFLVATVLLAR